MDKLILHEYILQNWDYSIFVLDEIEIEIINDISTDENLTNEEKLILLKQIENNKKEFRNIIYHKYNNLNYNCKIEEVEELKNKLLLEYEKKKINPYIFRKEFFESLTNPIIPRAQSKIVLNIPHKIHDKVKETMLLDRRNILLKELNILGKTEHKTKQISLNTYFGLGEILFYLKNDFSSTTKFVSYLKTQKYDFIEIYSRRYIDKLIKFYKLVHKYPIILKSTFTFHNIINNVKIIEEILFNIKWVVKPQKKN